MTDIPNLAFEAQLWSATHRINAKKEETYVVVLHAHPLEAAQLMDSDLLGKRFQCVLVAIGDDEQPEKVGGEVAEQEPKYIPFNLDEHEPLAKPKRRWDEMSRAQQAGVLCGDPDFQNWLGNSTGCVLLDPKGCAACLRRYLGVKSRTELNNPGAVVAIHTWDGLVSDYRQATGQVTEQRG